MPKIQREVRKMRNTGGSKKQLVAELETLRSYLAELEESQAKREWTEQLLTTLFATSPIGIYIAQERQFQSVSREFAQIIGYSHNELIGIHTLSIVHPEDRNTVRESAVKMLKEERSSSYEFRVITKGGETRWVMETVASTQYQGRRAVLGNFMDITERKQAEEELKKAHRELKGAIAQLVHTERMTALGELTAGIAHELNQPLNNIKIASQDLLHDINKNRLDINTLPQDLEDVVRQVNKMAEIIDHMRVFTRRLDGLSKEEVDINQTINSVFMLFGEQLRVHNIEVIKDLAPDLPKVLGDPTSLEQVFMNLTCNAQNAIEDFRKTGRRLEIKSLVNNEKEVAISIKDNGGGVPLNVRNRIFEPFFTTRRPGQGTGLGLSITRKIIEEHNGRIELEVEEGKESTFTVILPTVGKERKLNAKRKSKSVANRR